MDAERRLRAEVYHSIQDLERVRPEWESLLAQFPSSTTFSTLTWLIPWWRAFGGDDRLQVIGFRDRAGSLAGLAPLSLTSSCDLWFQLRWLRFMGDGSQDSDNLDFPVRRGFEALLSLSLLEWLEKHRQDWDICRLSRLPAASLVGNRLLADIRALGWSVFISRHPCSAIELPESWELYLKRLSSKERGKIGLRTRRLEKRYRVEIRKCSEAGELDAALEALFELHRKHWQLRGLPGTLHVPARRQFYHELALQLAGAALELWTLKLEGRIVATQFGFRHRDVVFSLQEGFDPELSSDSVGYVLRAQVLKRLIAAGVRRYDFLGGTDESKTRCGAVVGSYLNVDFARPFSRGSLHLRLKYNGAECKAWLRNHLPETPWSTLKALRQG